MTDFIEIHWSAGSLDEARKVARYLVQERWVAKAQIIPWFESITMLDNQLETSQESKVILITVRERFQEIAKMIRQNSLYDVPEITQIDVQDGNEEYLKWLKESCAP